MPKAFFYQAFTRWLAQNQGRFTHPPRITQRRRNHVVMRFRGVTPHIVGVVSDDGTTFHILHADKTLDMLEWNDIAERRTANGSYYCGLCTEPIHYASRQELWEQHCFEPMLESANATFQPGQWLHACITHGGSSWASIRPHGPIEQETERLTFSAAWPVLLNQPGENYAPNHRDH